MACHKPHGHEAGARKFQQKKNAAIFRILLNKVSFHRICGVEGITVSTVYRKIDLTFVFGMFNFMEIHEMICFDEIWV